MKFISRSEKNTKQFAKGFAKRLRGGEILTLYGNLGSGKTTFTRGLAEGLKIKKTIHSPTFVLMRIFKAPAGRVKMLAHIDAYRLKRANELEEIGALDYLGKKNTVTVVEWPKNAQALLRRFNKRIVKINFSYGKKINERIIRIAPKQKSR